MDINEIDQRSNIAEIRAAALKNDPEAQFNLGWYYYLGNGVAQDRREAIDWYRRAAEQGLNKAQEILSIVESKDTISKMGDPEVEDETDVASSLKWIKILALLVIPLAAVGILTYYAVTSGLLFNADDRSVGTVDSNGPEAVRNLQPEPTEHKLGSGRLLMNELARFSEEWLDAQTDPNEADER